MKKFMFLIALITLCCFGAVQAQAANTGTISVTVSLGVISVTLAPDSWNIGPILLSGTSSESFTTTVGNVSTDLNIKGSNGDGGWAIGTAGSDIFEVEVTGSGITTFSLATSDLDLATVAAGGNKDFNLTYKAPSEDTKGAVSQDFIVTVTATPTP